MRVLQLGKNGIGIGNDMHLFMQLIAINRIVAAV